MVRRSCNRRVTGKGTRFQTFQAPAFGTSFGRGSGPTGIARQGANSARSGPYPPSCLLQPTRSSALGDMRRLSLVLFGCRCLFSLQLSVTSRLTGDIPRMTASRRIVSLLGPLLLVAFTTRVAVAGVVEEIAKSAVEPTVNAISDAASTLWTRREEPTKSELKTIRSQLEAAKWPNFDDIAAH